MGWQASLDASVAALELQPCPDQLNEFSGLVQRVLSNFVALGDGPPVVSQDEEGSNSGLESAEVTL
jgi:hypothetical protein